MSNHRLKLVRSRRVLVNFLMEICLLWGLLDGRVVLGRLLQICLAGWWMGWADSLAGVNWCFWLRFGWEGEFLDFGCWEVLWRDRSVFGMITWCWCWVGVIVPGFGLKSANVGSWILRGWHKVGHSSRLERWWVECRVNRCEAYHIGGREWN